MSEILIKYGWGGKFAQFYGKIMQNNPISGRDLVVDLHKGILDTVTSSFSHKEGRMKNVTDQAINERLDKCIQICLDLDAEGWSTRRIIDQIEQKFFESFDLQDKKDFSRSTWGSLEKDKKFELDK